jgi:hypothetical protein
MALPEQIRKQVEAVQQLYTQLNPEDSAAADQQSDNQNLQEGQVSAEQHTADDSHDANSASAPPAPDEKSGGGSVSEEAVLQKYKTLQGMYNAEVPRLHQQNRDMAQKLQQMEQLLASLSAQNSTQQTAQAVSAVAEKLVSEQDVAEFGDSIDVMRKVSREELTPVAQRLIQLERMLQQMQTSVVPQVQAVAQRQQVNAEQQFWADLATAVPNFRDINGNDAFQSWLLEADPLTGITRQTYLEDAQRSLDARRVSNFFRTWLDSTGQNPVANAGNRAASSELEKQVAPGRSRGAGAPSSSNKAKTYTPQDIQQFFADVRQGKYKGREQERNRIEGDIFAAQRENRIVQNV